MALISLRLEHVAFNLDEEFIIIGLKVKDKFYSCVKSLNSMKYAVIQIGGEWTHLTPQSTDAPRS